MRAEHTDAILLRSVDYGEADRIVTLLTRRFGRLAFIARGARRSKRRFGGALEPFAVLRVGVVVKETGLGTLQQAELSSAHPKLLGSLDRMAAAGAASELLRELTTEGEVDEAVFDTAVELLQALDDVEQMPGPALLCFELRLLSLVGFAPRLDACGRCGKRPRSEQSSMFDPEGGALVCRSCGRSSHRLSGASRARMAAAQGSDWLAAARAKWPRSELGHDAAALRAFVEHRLGKPWARAVPASLW